MTSTPPASGVQLSEAALVRTLRAAGCVFAEDEARLLLAQARTPAELAVMVGKRVAGLPLEHILGWAEFCGLRVAVDEGVFVPRRRTEFLARRAAALVRPGTVVVDLCCGTGAVGVAVASIAGPLELHAADIDPVAVRCARRNVEPVGGRVYEGDLDAPLPVTLRGRVGVLVANVPYVPTGAVATMPPEARDHESRVALDGGTDGLDLVRRVMGVAPRWLAPGGHVLVEISEAQATSAADTVVCAGLLARVDECAESGATIVVGTAP